MNRHFFLVGIRKIHRNALIYMNPKGVDRGRQPPPPQNA